MNTKIVLISGKARAGKDTFANYFRERVEKEGKVALIIKYGDIIKFVCEKYFNWDGQKDLKGRTLLQQVGTNLCRNNNPDVWVNCVIELIKGLYTEVDYVLIPDTRFPNEIQGWMGTGFDFVSVRITRVDDNRKEYDNGLTEEQKNHESELALDNWVFDYNVYNKQKLDLVNSADLIFEEMEEF